MNFRDKPEHIRLTGGASRSEVWAQIFADIFEVPVEIPDGTELGALGAAMCAAVSVGVHGSFEAAADAMVRIARTHRPNARWADVYRRKYARYKRLLEAMAPVWAELAWPSS